ncbi:MAG: UDP-N-acetylmuramoyl-L-alanine--D-glutamate ligase [Alteromonadaceae bacterium]|uniref:UDP-N-acetylmuramoyl-L-alanine--D-glutamate ligase n=1 Tax=Paraglaciecola chathamensis TaxID=368405 RepID=UPI000C5448FB|nr:UDP-N-acetylmuramoyl-L-alanine--D-glutamate ligase [Paraglaciecola agarilytica]MBN26340.1 UDP-N-acetylmuramoyl-L-alanine--D-glutamate ligase [Alteromonadaceae bacterium]|tara:strand:- start:46801 stop:48126 length:1326 start_codon:yes stop_codon:yes gene_type:complete
MAANPLANKNIIVVGLGLTGLSCVTFLLAKGANVSAMDTRADLNVSVNVPVFLGELDSTRLCSADMLVVSPGLSLQTAAIQEAIEAGVQVVGDIELFAMFNNTPVLAVTGSNGKSTVATLAYEMCIAGGKKALLGGNIGTPALELLEKDADIIVLELSSFQLESTHTLRPLVACMLNLSDDHLDRHGDMLSYQRAKLRIYKDARFSVCNRDDAATWPMTINPDVMFGLSSSERGLSWDKDTAQLLLDGKAYLDSQACMLVGEHNMLNIQAATAMTMLAGVDLEAIKSAAMNFAGLAHRCQTVAASHNVRWINDSKATNVGATIAAIDGLAPSCKGKLILIAGGDGKGADFAPLQDRLTQQVSELITIGKDGPKLAALRPASHQVATLDEAVNVAASLVTKDSTVLLSPACASLDMFKNYQQRGELFVQAVNNLVSKQGGQR